MNTIKLNLDSLHIDSAPYPVIGLVIDGKPVTTLRCCKAFVGDWICDYINYGGRCDTRGKEVSYKPFHDVQLLFKFCAYDKPRTTLDLINQIESALNFPRLSKIFRVECDNSRDTGMMYLIKAPKEWVLSRSEERRVGK